jgi:hypothetical protein
MVCREEPGALRRAMKLETIMGPGCGEHSRGETRLGNSLRLTILPVKRWNLESFAYQHVYTTCVKERPVCLRA